jgi:two-component system sensor histidine kinase DesK
VTGYGQANLERELAGARSALKAAGVRFEILGQVPAVSPKQEKALALALREAVTNVMRHAEAQVCRLRMESGPEGLLMQISDDGCGGDFVEGAGMRGMRERIANLGGSLGRDTEEGTRLTITLPPCTAEPEA